MAARKNAVERFVARIQRKPVVAAAIAIGTLVIALSSFTDASKNLLGLFDRPSPEDARAELARLSLDFSAETFVERVREGDVPAVNLFLVAGMEPNVTTGEDRNTVLMVAAANGRASIVEALVEAGADVNRANRRGVTALMNAALQSNTAIVRTLIAAKADIHHESGSGDTALSFAAAAGHEANVTLLIDAGARPEAINHAFVEAGESRQPAIARLLLERGADVDKAGPEALVRAITQDGSSDGVNDTVRFMLDVIGDVSGQDSNGWSAVHLAAHRGNPGLLRLLLEKGADVNRVCECNGYSGARNWTPLQIAAFRGRREIVELLLARGADLRHANTLGATPLHSAVESDTPAIVQLLVDKGADMQAKDKKGRTPRDYASDVPDEQSRAEIIRLLK
jgi:ankyrin repeat protein